MNMMLTEPVPVPRAAIPARDLISIPFLLLRGISTAGLMAAAMIQIFVFARVMSPEQFSIFILVGTVGYSLWLCDLGVVKLLFVRLRAARLARKRNATLAKQAAAIVLLYASLAVAGAALCFLFMSALPSVPAYDAAGYALFFLFTSLNLTWYALRNISIAIDDYVYFEGVEAIRRFVTIGIILLMLAGLSVPAFLIVVNLLWVLSLAIAVTRLRRRNVLTMDLRGAFASLWSFYRGNRRDLLRSATSATSDFYIEHLPYLIVPFAFGLGAPTVILDAIFKFVRGASLYFNAICEIVVPRQTSALAERDAATLIRATLLAVALALVPTLVVCAGLIAAGDAFFRLLLGPAATMPSSAVWVISAMLFATLIQNLAHSLLIHSGFFKEDARVMALTAAAATLVPALALLISPTVVGFLGFYAAAFAGGALVHAAVAVRGPIRAAGAT